MHKQFQGTLLQDQETGKVIAVPDDQGLWTITEIPEKKLTLAAMETQDHEQIRKRKEFLESHAE